MPTSTGITFILPCYRSVLDNSNNPYHTSAQKYTNLLPELYCPNVALIDAKAAPMPRKCGKGSLDTQLPSSKRKQKETAIFLSSSGSHLFIHVSVLISTVHICL